MLRALADLDTSRPVLIATARVSIEEIDYTSIPEDAYIFRDGAIDEEDHFWLGHEIAAWFVAPRASAVEHLRQESYRQSHRVTTVLTDAKRARAALGPSLQVEHATSGLEDWVEYLLDHPATARLATSDHPPSVPVVMLATALSLGFTDVLILDGQFNHDYLRWIEPARTVESTVDRGMRPIGRISTSYELGAMEELAAAFPQASVTDVAASRPYARLLPPSEREHRHSLLPQPRPELGHPNDLWALRRGLDGVERRVAYVTAFDNDGYFWGAIALAESLREFTEIPLLALVPLGYVLPADVPLPENMTIVRAPRIRNALFGAEHQKRFEYTFSKLAAFSLTFLERAVYLDADTIVLKPIDELFEGDGFAAAPDFGFTLNREDFNSGVFSFSPSATVFRELMRQNGVLTSNDGGDQGFLNSFFPDAGQLGREYNTLWRMFEANPGLTDFSAVKVLHFVGPKPWRAISNDLPEWLENAWLERLGERYETLLRKWQEAHVKVEVEVRPAEPAPQPPAAEAQTPVAEAQTPKSSHPQAVEAPQPSPKRRPAWERARVLATSGDLDKAHALVKLNLLDNPHSPRNHRTLAIVHRRQGHPFKWFAEVTMIPVHAALRALGSKR